MFLMPAGSLSISSYTLNSKSKGGSQGIHTPNFTNSFFRWARFTQEWRREENVTSHEKSLASPRCDIYSFVYAQKHYLSQSWSRFFNYAICPSILWFNFKCVLLLYSGRYVNFTCLTCHSAWGSDAARIASSFTPVHRLSFPCITRACGNTLLPNFQWHVAFHGTHVQTVMMLSSLTYFSKFHVFFGSAWAYLQRVWRRRGVGGGHRMASPEGFLPSRATALTWTRHQRRSRDAQCITAQQTFATRRFAEAAVRPLQQLTADTGRPPFATAAIIETSKADWRSGNGAQDLVHARPCSWSIADSAVHCYNIVAVAIVWIQHLSCVGFSLCFSQMRVFIVGFFDELHHARTSIP